MLQPNPKTVVFNFSRIISTQSSQNGREIRFKTQFCLHTFESFGRSRRIRHFYALRKLPCRYVNLVKSQHFSTTSFDDIFFLFVGIFALLSTIPTAGSLHMHFMNLRNQFEKFYTKDRLKFTGYFGIFLAPIGFIGKLTSSSSTILKI